MIDSVTLEVGRQAQNGEWLTMTLECPVEYDEVYWATTGRVIGSECVPDYTAGQIVPLTHEEQGKIDDMCRKMAEERRIEAQTLAFEARRERDEERFGESNL